ncbi:unnamed protein product [Schistocephalus solidus]|uniref:N-terminal acetyltransferase B complex auxiliary subunit NAA25 n=1 Tax=Schistocephalus solidus TaxID=70667 RepID=A0A183TFN9_SCHSO|nr:unnamed protein product [Schistocephalus solidus]
MELMHHVSESLGAAEFLHYFLPSFAIHRIKGFLQIHECRLEVNPHLKTLLLQLPCSEDYIGGAAMTAETALAFQKESLFQMAAEVIEGNAGEDFPGDV